MESPQKLYLRLGRGRTLGAFGAFGAFGVFRAFTLFQFHARYAKLVATCADEHIRQLRQSQCQLPRVRHGGIFLPIAQWWPGLLRRAWPKHPCTDNASRPGQLASAPSASNGAASYARQPSGWQASGIKSSIGIDKDVHPPTDNTSRPEKLDAAPNASTEAASYAWQRSGWQPFAIKSIIGIDKDFLKITGILDHQRICLYIQRLVEHHLHTQAFSEKSLAMVKANPDTSQQLSILLPHGVPITLSAFLLLADARSDLSQRIQAKKAQTSGAHSTVAAQSSKRPSTLSRQPNRLPPPPPGKTTMALAFRRAQEKKDNT
ncbi:hypothetical protein A3K88_07750 [Pseudomonas putida]|nr:MULTISPECIES: hypothetical protein [unclassified Pseudomonas]MDM1714221.1 hypothetical protein [Pseudomonas sp. 165]OAK53350.1 hypothetical protein A3K88_07750 [Pseudomonas putida]PPB16738.1 hypothetical protein HV87_19565 [Pseudomonas aeruginosa]QDR68356.1 hypothetical protein FPB55_12190 [Pseudomonas sp. BJP69]